MEAEEDVPARLQITANWTPQSLAAAWGCWMTLAWLGLTWDFSRKSRNVWQSAESLERGAPLLTLKSLWWKPSRLSEEPASRPALPVSHSAHLQHTRIVQLRSSAPRSVPRHVATGCQALNSPGEGKLISLSGTLTGGGMWCRPLWHFIICGWALARGHTAIKGRERSEGGYQTPPPAFLTAMFGPTASLGGVQGLVWVPWSRFTMLCTRHGVTTQHWLFRIVRFVECRSRQRPVFTSLGNRITGAPHSDRLWCKGVQVVFNFFVLVLLWFITYYCRNFGEYLHPLWFVIIGRQEEYFSYCEN